MGLDASQIKFLLTAVKMPASQYRLVCGVALSGILFGKMSMPDTSKTGSDKTTAKPEKGPDTTIKPEGSFQQQKQDSDSQRAAEQKKGGAVALPELSISGSDAKTEKGGEGAAAKSGSWSTQELSKALRYLDSIKPAAERSFTTSSAGERAQGHTYILLRDKILPELKKEGKIGAEWQLYPSVSQSPADKVGADYLLVNTKTGAFHFLDATLKENKDNVFGLRAGGVLIVDNRLFDEFSALKTNESGDIGLAAQKLETDISSQIESLAKSTTPFVIGPDGTPMPSVTVVTEEQAKTQIRQLSTWATEQADASSGNEARLFRDMAAVVERPFRQLDKAAREVASPKLSESVARATESEIVKFGLAKYRKQNYDSSAQGSSKNQLHILKDGKLVMPVDSGEIHVGGNITEHLEKSWTSLLSEKKLLSLVSNKDLIAMGADITSFEKLTGDERAEAIYKAYRSQPKFKSEANKLRDIIHSEQQVIKAGGAQGTGDPVIVDNIMAKLRSRTDNALLGIAPKPEAAATDTAKTKSSFSDIEKSAAKPVDALADFAGYERYGTDKASESLATSMDLLLADQEDRRAKEPTSKDLWPQAEFDRFSKLSEAYKDPAHQDHAESVKQLHELLNKKADKAEADAEAAQALLKGNPVFERLNDEVRMKDALKQLSDRTKSLPAQEKDEYMARQIKEAVRKHLGVATNAELPESISKLKVKLVDGNGSSVKVTESGVMEIPAKFLKDNPKKAIAEAYAHATGLSMLDVLKQEGNEHLTMRSLKPMLSKIAERAEKVVASRLESSGTSGRTAISADAASSERKAELPKARELVTNWDGESLTFGNEKFNVRTELTKLNAERETKIKELESEIEKAKALAEAKKTDETQQRVKSLEQQLEVERQNAKVSGDLQLALNGSRGAEARSKAESLVKQAAEKAMEAHLSKRGASGSMSRATAVVLVLTTLSALAVQNNASAKPDVYEGRFGS